MTDQFDPQDIAEIEATLNRAEAEENTSVCLYMELPYTGAASIVQWYVDWTEGGDYTAFMKVLEFIHSLVGSLEMTLAEYGEP